MYELLLLFIYVLTTFQCPEHKLVTNLRACQNIVIFVIVISEFLERHSKARRTRAPV